MSALGKAFHPCVNFIESHWVCVCGGGTSLCSTSETFRIPQEFEMPTGAKQNPGYKGSWEGWWELKTPTSCWENDAEPWIYMMTWLILVLSTVLICVSLSRSVGRVGVGAGGTADFDNVGLHHVIFTAVLSNGVAKDRKTEESGGVVAEHKKCFSALLGLCRTYLFVL